MTTVAPSRPRPTLLLIVGVLLLSLLAGWLVYRALHTTWVYDYQATFSAVPKDDRALEDWIRSQPGVTAASVAREGRTVAIHFEMQSWQHEPQVMREVETLGYTGRVGFEGRVTSRW